MSSYTNKEIQANMREEARLLSDSELRSHYRISIYNRDNCGECFCCICGKVLKERKIQRWMDALSTNPVWIARREARLREANQRLYDKHIRANSPK